MMIEMEAKKKYPEWLERLLKWDKSDFFLLLFVCKMLSRTRTRSHALQDWHGRNTKIPLHYMHCQRHIAPIWSNRHMLVFITLISVHLISMPAVLKIWAARISIMQWIVVISYFKTISFD